jgi:hypothetical protein
VLTVSIIGNGEKSLEGSIQTTMIYTERVFFMILPLLFVPAVYGLSYTPDACANQMT